VRVPVKVQVDIVNELLARIQVSMDSPIAKQPATYLQAANFYFDHTTDAKSLAQALAWVNIGIINARAPASYGLLYLKAKILAKEGDRAGATQAAQQSIALATEVEGPGTPYYKMNLEVISGMR
jgi:hypothetical protein